MLGQIDKACNDAGVWPHAVLSAHAHNYQRFTRLHGKTQNFPILSAATAVTAWRSSAKRG